MATKRKIVSLVNKKGSEQFHAIVILDNGVEKEVDIRDVDIPYIPID